MRNFITIFFILIFSVSNAQNIPILKHKNVEITKLDILNSSFRETNISISPDGKYLYFFSSRGGQTWSYPNYNVYNGKSQYDGDIWCSEKKGGKWQKPVCLDKIINTSIGEDEPNISPDGQSLIFQSWRYDYENRPYYISKKIGSKWSEPKRFGKNITLFFKNESWATATDGMSISPDGNKFIVACGNDYDGNLNFYFSKKTNEKWAYPKPMAINTKKDERSIFIAGDGQTIFFASDGYGGYGGLDIFKANIDENGKCSNITNIGKPFNTDRDDLGFIITASGKEAYFVRDGDIYYANLKDIDNRLIPKPTVIVSGRIYDCNKKPVETTLELINVDKNMVVGTSKTDAKTGEYSIVLPEQSGNYKIVDTKKKKTLKKFRIEKKNIYQKIEYNIEIKCPNSAAGGRRS